MAAGYERDYWGNGSRRVVEELHTDEDSDLPGAGLITARETRFSSDPLHFTGIDLGGNTARQRRKYAYTQSEEEDSSDSEQDTELDEEGYAQVAREEEEALVDSAMRRIRRAQASGKKEVKLSKKELAAMEKYKKRQSEGESRKKREPRYAVPLSQLAPTSQKENKVGRLPAAMPSTEALQRQTVQQPPVGWFPHPSSSRPGTSDPRRPTSSRTSDREGSTSPFQYNYVRPAAPVSNSRHSSDPTLRPRSGSTRGNLPYPDAHVSQYNPSSSAPSVPATLDPFRYMTSGPQAPYHAGSAASLRTVSGSSMGAGYYEPSTRGGAIPTRRISRRFTPDDEDSSSEDGEDEDETSDEADAGARIGASFTGPSPNGREEIVVEVDREPTPEPRMTRSKKAPISAQASPRSSPKPAPKRRNTGGGRRKKGSK